MITSTVQAHDMFDRIDDVMDAKTVAGLNEAARAASTVAEQQADGVSTFQEIPAHGTANGFESGIKARNPLWRIFDKGTLGKRRAGLKGRNRRKESWTVTRKGTQYEAHRRDTQGKGISARNISNPARAAGRKILNATVRR